MILRGAAYLVLVILAFVSGFTLGDQVGRNNALYDDDKLRKHYAGECYEKMEEQKDVVYQAVREACKQVSVMIPNGTTNALPQDPGITITPNDKQPEPMSNTIPLSGESQ